MTKERRRADWARKIEEQSQSGLSINQWCQHKGINDKTFRRWKSNLKTKEKIQEIAAVAAPTGWCQVQTKPAVEKSANLKLVVNSQITIELEPGFDPELLREVLAVLCP